MTMKLRTWLAEPRNEPTANLNKPNSGKPTSGAESINQQRRNLIGGAVATLLATSGRAVARENEEQAVGNPFILLLNGIYQPVPHLPDLGLSGVDLADTSYAKTKIYPIFGVQGGEENNAIGDFYGSFTNPVCVYDLPGGAIAMQFASGPVYQDIGFNTFVPFPDGKGGFYLEGTFELSIPDATGIYRPFKGGHNHMVDRLHQLDAAGTQFNEFCFCNVSKYQFP